MGKLASFFSLPVFLQLVGFDKYLKHWVLLVEAVHILLQKSVTVLELRRAHQLLKKFVALTEVYYTKDAMSYNIHQLIHMVQSVLDWGPLWAHCGYPFESGNGKILRMVHAAKGVLNQIFRNLSMNESLMILEKHVQLKERSPIIDFCYYLNNRSTQKTEAMGNNRYFGKRLNPRRIEGFNLSYDTSRAYEKLVKDKCLFQSCNKINYRSNNSFAQTMEKEFIQIVQFIIDRNNNKEYTVYKKVVVESCFSDECTSVMKVICIENSESIIETKNVLKQCVFMTVGENRFISAVPHMYWYS